MTFGETIRQLLKINNLKMGHLALALDYDISYISKWVNNTKLPPAQNIRAISLGIAQFIRRYGTEETLKNTVIHFRLYDVVSDKSALSKDDNFKEAVANLLVDVFHSKPNDTVVETSAELPTGNLFLPADNRSPDFSATLSQLFSQAFSSCGSTTVECTIIISPTNCPATDDHILEELDSLCALYKKKIHIRQLTNISCFREYPAEVCSHILKRISYSVNIEFEFFVCEFTPSQPFSGVVLLLKDTAVMQVFFEPFIGTPYAAVTWEPSIVSEYYWTATANFKRLESVVKRMPVSIFDRNNISYQHTLLPMGRNRCLFREMCSIHFAPEMLEELLNTYVPDTQLRALIQQQHTIAFSTPTTVFLYKSTIVEYIKTGHIHLFNPERVCLSVAQRKRHLQHLIDEIIKEDILFLHILDDTNDILCYDSNLFSVLYNNGSGFANTLGKNYYNVFSPSLREALSAFFAKLQSICMSRELTVEFLINCHRML